MAVAVAPSSRRRNSPLWVMLAGAGAFLALALAAIALPSVPGDLATRECLLGLATPPVVATLRVVNHAGSWRLLFPATLLLLVAFPRARQRWRISIVLMLAAPGRSAAEIAGGGR